MDYGFDKYMRTPWYSRDYKDHYRIGGLSYTRRLAAGPHRLAERCPDRGAARRARARTNSGDPAFADDAHVQRHRRRTAFASTTGSSSRTAQRRLAASDRADPGRVLARPSGKYGNDDRRDRRRSHAQTVREDQLDALRSAWASIPSFFGMQTLHWGDWHRDVTLGAER